MGRIPPRKIRRVPPKKRKLVTRREQLMAVLRNKLRKLGFFERLARTRYSTYIRVFEFEGMKVAIKDTKKGGFWADSGGLRADLEGLNFEQMRQDFLQHQLAVRKGEIKPEKYVVKSIKVFGTINNRYLIMQFIEGYKKKYPSAFNFMGLRDVRDAISELRINFRKLREKKKIVHIPQMQQVIVGGKTKDGKWIFYLPYDYL